jgi:hypothetical protein
MAESTELQVKRVLDQPSDARFDEFLESVRWRLNAPAMLSVRDCTALLAGLDRIGWSATAKLTKVLESARPSVPWDPGSAPWTFGSRLALSEHYADELRRRRRAAFGELLAAFHRHGAFSELIEAGVLPLLERGPWLPAACYEPRELQRAFGSSELWEDAGLSAKEIREAVPQAGLADPIDALIYVLNVHSRLKRHLIDAGGPEHHQRDATALYVQHANAAWRQGLLYVEAPILFAPALPGWPLGHLCTAIVVSTNGEYDQSPLAEESLSPAIDIAAKLLDTDVLPRQVPVSHWDIAIGDYPGGVDPLLGNTARPVGGSAAVMLAAALIASKAGLQMVPWTFATSKLGRDGLLIPLRASPQAGAEQLRSKARALALRSAAWDAAPVVLVADAEDGACLADAAAACGAPFDAVAVPSFPDAVDHLVADLHQPPDATVLIQIVCPLAQLAFRALPPGRYALVMDRETGDEQLAAPGASLPAVPMAGEPELAVAVVRVQDLYPAVFKVGGDADPLLALLVRLNRAPAGTEQARRVLIERQLTQGRLLVVLSGLLDERRSWSIGTGAQRGSSPTRAAEVPRGSCELPGNCPALATRSRASVRRIPVRSARCRRGGD